MWSRYEVSLVHTKKDFIIFKGLGHVTVNIPVISFIYIVSRLLNKFWWVGCIHNKDTLGYPSISLRSYKI